MLGRPGENLVMKKLPTGCNTDYGAVSKTILSETATVNGCSGVKFHYHQFEEYSRYVSIGSVFGDCRWIFVDRRDLIAQSVSLAKAWQTRKFSSKHAAVNESVYDPIMIEKAGLLLAAEKAKYEFLFCSLKIHPLRVFYEDILKDENAEISRIADFLNVVPRRRVSIGSVSIVKQADSESNDWAERFVCDMALRYFGV